MKKLNTEWNLGLLYKSEKDPKINSDLKKIESLYSSFEKKYKNKDFISSPLKLTSAFKDFENLRRELVTLDPWWYFALKVDLNSEDVVSKAMATKLDQRITNASNKIKFFYLTIGKISKKEQIKYLNNSSLKPYKYVLSKIFTRAQYYLTEEEEQLATLLSQTSYEMWIEHTQKIMNKLEIPFKNKKITLVEAIGSIPNLPKKERHELNPKVNEALKSIADIATAELNAVYNFKKTMDERRGYPTPYSETVLGHENKDKDVEMLTKLISKNFKISNRFYNLHTRLLKERKLNMADRSAKLGDIKKKFDFETSVDIVKKAFRKVDPIYSDILDRFVENSQIDVYPKKGKRGGAYCWGTDKKVTYVLLNHLDEVRSVETLAHEMGHAIHTELSKKQPPLYTRYTTAAAEVASTFFEQVVLEDLENHLDEKEKIILLHNKIMGDMATIFRQIAFFNFEYELNIKIREKGQLDAKEIADLMRKHLQTYLGKDVDVTLDDGYFFVYISHIRRFFYVYTYAYGQIVSRALYENWKKDSKYALKVQKFLSAGGSMSPEDIFKSIGIDTSDPEFFKAGLKGIERDIIRLEKLTKDKTSKKLKK